MEHFSILCYEAMKCCSDSQYAQAELLFKEALEITPQHCSIEEKVNVTAQLADALFLQKKFAEAEDYYETSIDLIKDDEIFWKMKVECYMKLGATLGNQGRFTEARDLLIEALKMIKASPEKHENAGDSEVDETASVIYHNLADLMYYLCEEKKEKEYRAIARNIDLTLRTIAEAEKKGLPTKHIIRRYIKPYADEMLKAVKKEEVYEMGATGVHGFCLIINNRFFKYGPPRRGSEIDEANISNVFKQLNFDVSIEIDLSAKLLIETVRQLVDKPENDNHNAFVLVIMSHGNAGMIEGSDGESASLHDILRPVYTATRLQGKPSLIIIQACQGETATNTSHHGDPLYEMDVSASSSNMAGKEIHEKHCCIMRAATDGFVAYRSPGQGSPFIAALTEALFEHSHTKHIEEIFKEAEKLMRNFNQRPIMDNFLRRKFYFLPAQ